MSLSPERREALAILQDLLGYHFREPELLDLALTHKSFVNERPGGLASNERLEFLGDAVLNLMISHYLYGRLPRHPEGQLSKLRASIVNNLNLAKMAQQISLGDFILLGKGEQRDGGRLKPSILASCLEALIGAIYWEAGLEKVTTLFFLRWGDHIAAIVEKNQVIDYKGIVQEIVQRRWGCLPVYEVVRESGPPHQRSFEISLSIRGQIYGLGCGKSKKEAEQEAAMLALEKLQDFV